ncbi:MAG TPA: ATP-binding cassette domain-containing protein, partial [Opitutaceae bacterium]|nr:ATP-binding cassette domain-containing protein [Opitutaceae bacterium]
MSVRLDELSVLTQGRGPFMFVLVGPNGAGKTTLFNLIGGRYRPTAGTVIFNGRDVTERVTRLGL